MYCTYMDAIHRHLDEGGLRLGGLRLEGRCRLARLQVLELWDVGAEGAEADSFYRGPAFAAFP